MQEQKIWKKSKFTTFVDHERAEFTGQPYNLKSKERQAPAQRKRTPALAYLEQAVLHVGKESSAKFVSGLV